MRTVRSLPLQARFSPIGSVDAKARTAVVEWTTGAAVRRYDWARARYYLEVLSLEDGAIRMERLRSGSAPLLNTHARYDLSNVIGVVQDVYKSGQRQMAKVKFSDRADVEPIFQDVKAGILRNISIGYYVHEIEMAPPANDGDWNYIVTDWEPMEISLVPIGADPGAGVRAHDTEQRTFPCTFIRRGDAMKPDGGENEHDRNEEEEIEDAENEFSGRKPLTARTELEIRKRVTRAKLPGTFADSLVEQRISFKDACVRICDEIAARAPAAQGASMIEGMRDNGGEPIQNMTAMLVARCGGPAPSDSAKRYANSRIIDMARELLELRGTRTTLLSRDDILARSLHSSSDFPNLLQQTGNRILRMGYDSYKGGAKVIAKQITAPDFRAINRLNLGEAPTLKKVLPGAEVTRGSMAEAKEAYVLETFARIFGINRQALINDDLGAFAQLSTKYGRAAAEFESQQIVTLLTSNPAMSDGVALFHANHANKAGAPAPISVTTLGAAKQAMRLQKGLDGATPIDVTPKYLLAPAALEAVALQYVTQLTPAQSSNVNPFAGQLQVVVDPRLDAVSATAWYLAADQSSIDTIEYAYLQDAPGVQLEVRVGFDIEGVELKARLDFGCGVLDFRGLYINT